MGMGSLLVQIRRSLPDYQAGSLDLGQFASETEPVDKNAGPDALGRSAALTLRLAFVYAGN
jgi:hypothetical protein